MKVTVPFIFFIFHMNIRIEKSWREALKDEFEKEYFKDLSRFVREEYANAKVYPPPKELFRAFEHSPFSDTRVVILGQDPYHGPAQANGLCFAVNSGVKNPPSLRNIFKEIESDLGKPPKSDSELLHWATQGVLLLNSTLTVREGSPASHHSHGWERFTDTAIQTLSENKEHLVFLLWGRFAKEKGALINREKHLVLESAHPSPFSAYGGFFGSKHFSKANAYLEKHASPGIDW